MKRTSQKSKSKATLAIQQMREVLGWLIEFPWNCYSWTDEEVESMWLWDPRSSRR